MKVELVRSSGSRQSSYEWENENFRKKKKAATTTNYNQLLPNANYCYRIIKISFLKKKGSWKKFPMSAASMSRLTMRAYLRLYLKICGKKGI